MKSTRYNQELEQKLRSYKIDYSEIEIESNDRKSDRYTLKPTDVGKSDNLCSNCENAINRRFLGVSNNTQLLGDELLDCISDNFTLEAAVFSFMEKKVKLEQELIAIEATQRDLENIMNSDAFLNESFNWSGSQLSIASDSSRL